VERRTERAQTGQFVVDGPVLAAEALRGPLEVARVFVGADLLDGADGGTTDVDLLCELARSRDVPVVPVVPGVLERLADPVSPRPVLAVVQAPDTQIAAIPEPGDDADFLLVAVSVADPGNLGTLVRTAEAAGATGVVVLGDATDPFSPKAVRASAGSVLRVPVAVTRDLVPALDALARHWTLVATSVDGVPFDASDVSVPRPAVLLGSEAHGLDPRAAAAATHTLSIPMAGEVESLNVGVAGAVLAFELARQRRSRSGQ
jgi:RNA methyltransferase, TrmH family